MVIFLFQLKIDAASITILRKVIYLIFNIKNICNKFWWYFLVSVEDWDGAAFHALPRLRKARQEGHVRGAPAQCGGPGAVGRAEDAHRGVWPGRKNLFYRWILLYKTKIRMELYLFDWFKNISLCTTVKLILLNRCVQVQNLHTFRFCQKNLFYCCTRRNIFESIG